MKLCVDVELTLLLLLDLRVGDYAHQNRNRLQMIDKLDIWSQNTILLPELDVEHVLVRDLLELCNEDLV